MSVIGPGCSRARAAQDVTVTKDNAPIRQEPSKSSTVIDYLQTGEEVRVSSHPVNGEWYKVRAKNGQYGWIQMRFLSVEPPKEEEDEEPSGPTPEKDRSFMIRAFGGLDFFKPQDLNDVFAFNDLNYGYNFGGEFAWAFGNRISLLFRAETLLKDVVAKESTTGLIYNLSLRSYPIMTGVDFKFLKTAPIILSVSVLGGLAVATSFQAEALNVDVPNTTEISSSTLTTLLLVNLVRPLGRSFSVSASAGYRHLRTTSLDTANDNNGGRVFRIAGEYKPRVIDLSGFILNAGFAFHF